MKQLPSNPVTLRDIKKTLEEVPRSVSLNFIFSKDNYDEIEENAKQLAQEFDEKLGVTPLLVQGYQGLEDITHDQLALQSVIIAIASPPAPRDPGEIQYTDTVAFMKRGIENMRTVRTLAGCPRGPLIILMSEGKTLGPDGASRLSTDFGEQSIFLSSAVKVVSSDSMTLVRGRSLIPGLKYPSISDRILELDLE